MSKIKHGQYVTIDIWLAQDRDYPMGLDEFADRLNANVSDEFEWCMTDTRIKGEPNE